MEFCILGPLEVLDAGQEVALGGRKQRVLLAVLALHANEPVTIDLLIDELWGERPPHTAARTLQVYISRLRSSLAQGSGNGGVGATPVVTHERGYELRIDPEQLDSQRFERLVSEARRDLTAGRPESAAATLERALSLWRGPLLAGLATEQFARGEIARLEELRSEAQELLIESRLALGQHAEVVGQLEVLIAERPYRERLRAHLMLALYRSERQADALQAYQDARRTLVEELGVEPGERLRELERGILAQDPALAPPAKTQDVAARRPSGSRSRLPSPPTRTIGRDRDVDAVVELLGRADVRLATLIGPGGVGKTRLALEVARKMEPGLTGGAWFAWLAATASSDHVASAIAQAVGVTPLEGESPALALERFLALKEGLLVLDNFEHVLPAVPLIGDLLAAAPALAVLATSREPLRLQAEHRFDVAPLQVPAEADLAAVEQAAAGALFAECARRNDRAFELNEGNAGAVAEICRRLDGLPLAIELAAARTTLFDVDELNGRLTRALDVLGSAARDAPDRQRTLRATIDWSYDLLSAQEADAFARLAVFPGGATIEAAQEVARADLDALQGLVDKQLLVRRPGSGPDVRLSMLETVREYARERLAADPDASEIHERHRRRYLALAERAEPELLTRGEVVWLPRLDAEVDNFQAALDWSLRHGNPAHALRLAGLLARFWDIRNRNAEGLAWIEAALEAAGDDTPVTDRARARWAQAYLLTDLGAGYDPEGLLADARAKAVEALALARAAADRTLVADALLVLAGLDMGQTHPQRRRRRLADEALQVAAELGDDRLVAVALMERTAAVPLQDDASEIEQAAAALRKLGSTRLLLALYNNAAYNAIKSGRPEAARQFLAQAVPLAHELGDPVFLALTSGNVGLEALFTDDLDRAQDAFGEQLRLCREHVVKHLATEGLCGLAAIASGRGDPEHAARLLGAATAIGPLGDADVNAALDERFFAPARRHTPAWDAAHTAGAEMGFEESIALALGRPR